MADTLPSSTPRTSGSSPSTVLSRPLATASSPARDLTTHTTDNKLLINHMAITTTTSSMAVTAPPDGVEVFLRHVERHDPGALLEGGQRVGAQTTAHVQQRQHA